MNITKEELRDLLEYAEEDMRFGVALRGALSEIRHRRHLEAQGYKVKRNPSTNQGLPDFSVDGISIEHKRARNTPYADGTLKVEVQKSRGKPEKRLYDATFADVVSADVSAHTGKKNDYRYARGVDLKTHEELPHKWKPLQRIDKNWKASLKEVLDKS
jgi:hypothetical protein